MKIPFWRSKRETDLEKEINGHLEMSAEDQMERGASLQDASAGARRHLGNAAQIKELTRQSWGLIWLERLGHDLRYGLRALRGSPVFSIVAIIVLAVGIGANSAIFSVVNGVLLRPLPVHDQDQLVWVFGKLIKTGDIQPLSYPDFQDWRSQNQVFSRMAAILHASYTLTSQGNPERVKGWVVSADIFPMIGIQPLLGRTFTADEEQDINGSGQVVVLNASFWRRKFGSDPNIVGKSIVLGKRPVIVIGVMPAEFRAVFGNNDQDDEDLWLPIGNKLNGQYGIEDQTMLSSDQPGIESIAAERNARLFFAIARLKPGIIRSTAQAEMDGIAGGLRDRYPEADKEMGVSITSALDPIVGDIREGLLIIFGAVGFVLLIACGNVANLMLARGLSRQREIAIRTALGAGRMRIIRQLLTESLLLSIFGCGLGLLIAFWGTRFLVKLGDQLSRVEEVRIDGRVLLFTITVSLVTGLIFGLIPAVQVSRIDLSQAVKEGGGSGASVRGGTIRNALIVSEVALTLILLTGAGLLIQSFTRLRQVNLGFKTNHVLTFHFDLPSDRYDESQQVIFGQQLQQRLESIPGVISASTAFSAPIAGFTLDTAVEIEGQGTTDTKPATVNFMSVGPGYFQTLGIPVIKGRAFDERDKLNSPMAVIISQAMAKRFFPDGDAVGKRIKSANGDDSQKKPPFREIVGVVGDVRQANHRTEPGLLLYFPSTQVPMSTVAFVHTAVDPLTLVSAIREEIKQIDGELPIYAVKPLDQLIAESIAQDGFNAELLAIFAGIALFLTAIGLYGVLAYSVTQRTREIGIRMALGAQRSGVLKMVIGHGLKLALIGTALGFAGALGLTSLISSFLFGVGAKDPMTLIEVTLVILITVMAACIVPAWRATRVDPMVALRCE